MINSTEKITKYQKRPDNPEEKASFLSKLTFFWLIDLFKFGLNNEITESEIYQVRKRDSSDKLWNLFRKLWEQEVTNGTNNLWTVIRSVFGWKIFLFGLIHSVVESSAR
jgi:ATP-binding cassette subfamily C (CFTR/MRP) protein 4